MDFGPLSSIQCGGFQVIVPRDVRRFDTHGFLAIDTFSINSRLALGG